MLNLNDQGVEAQARRWGLHLRQTPLAVIEWDLEGRIRCWNPAAERLFGYSAEEAIGLSIIELLVPAEAEVLDQVHRIAEDLTRMGSNSQAEHDNRRKDGSTVRCRWFTTSLTDDAGQALGVASMALDMTEISCATQALMDGEGNPAGRRASNRAITDRDRSEFEQLESEQRFRTIFEKAIDGIVIFSSSGEILAANDSFGRMHGRTPKALLGTGVWELNSLESNRLVPERMQRLLNGETLCIELKLVREDGSPFLTEATACMISFAGKPAILSFHRDITERKRMEELLRDSEKRFRHISSSMSDIVYSCQRQPGQNPAIDWMAGATELLLGRSIEEIKAHRCWGNFVLQEDMPLFRKHVLDLAPGESGACELRLRRKDGGWTWFQSYAQCEAQVEGAAPCKLFGALFDISERKKAEETRQLLEQEKHQAQKMDSLGSLAGGVAHDFNNMLGGIMGYADLLLAGEPDPIRQNHLRAIIAAASRSADLTQKLLAFGRRGRNIVESLDLPAMARECLELLRPSMPLELRVDVAVDGCPRVDGDPSQIHQVLMNLLINAIEAMPERGTLTLAAGGREVTESSNSGLPLLPGSYAQLSVSDSGIGMTEEVRERIFEPFFTTKNSAGIPGTGLGLSTAFGIVQAHGGAILAESVRGKGSTFHLFLPIGNLAPKKKVEATRSATAQGRILLVEDEPLLRELGTAALESLGYGVVSAADGIEAVDTFRAEHRHLCAVLLDLKMPRLQGKDAFKELRKINPGVPVLVCTGYGDNEEVQELLSMGAAGMLPKPYRILDLAAKLRQVTGG